MKKKDSEKTIFVTQGNYYSNEMAKIYTGSTQIKRISSMRKQGNG